MWTKIGCLRCFILGNRCTCASSQRRAPCRLDHVPSSYLGFVDHVIEWFVLQVQLDREFQQEPRCILQRKMLMLRNLEIEQVKVQWKQIGLMKLHGRWQIRCRLCILLYSLVE